MYYHKNLSLEGIHYINPDGLPCVEEWRTIRGRLGFYEISDLGRVKSLARKTYRKLTGWNNHKERILTPTDDGRGYLAVELSEDGRGKTERIHQLVAEAFHGHARCGYKAVPNHIDLDKYNNTKYNIEIVTARENSNHLHIPSVSKFVGVDYETRRSKWRSRIHFEGKKKHLGYFDLEADAAEAYQNALNNITLYGKIKIT